MAEIPGSNPGKPILFFDLFVHSVEGMSVVLITSPEPGSLCFNPDGSFTYTPDAVFTGTDCFLYVAEDELGDLWFSEYTQVTITVIDPSQTNVQEFPGMFVVIYGVILGTAFIATRMRIRR